MNQNRLTSFLPNLRFTFLTGKKRDEKKQPPAPAPPPDLEAQKARLRAYSAILYSPQGQLVLAEKEEMLLRLYRSPRLQPGIESTALLIHAAQTDGRISELEKFIDDLKTAAAKLAELEAKYPTVLKPKE